jgi:uncharacterized membrane protein
MVEAVSSPPRTAGRTPRHAAPVRWYPDVFIGMLTLVALLVPLHRWWTAQVMLVPLLLTVPGIILLRALRVPVNLIASFPVYVPCASIIVMFGSGLTVDVVGPLVGVAAPLRALPLLVGLEVTCSALLAASRNAPADVGIQWGTISRPASLAWPLILPLIAAAGALRLNSGHNAFIAIIAAFSFVALLVTAAVMSSRLGDTLLRVILHAASLAVLWSFSLRGDGLYGFDISTEYQRLQQTINSGIWHAAHPNDAYGAMLSVTVMPTELHELSGVPGLLVLKVVYPVLFAFFPVTIFDLARRILSPCWSFIAAAFTVGQYAFTEIASVARQEIGLIFFVALAAAMLETRMQRRSQWSLVVLLALGMALSHYSTTYFAITITGLMLPVQWVFSRFCQIPRVTGAVALAFLTAFAGAVIWYIPVTHSDSHLLQVAQTVQTQGLNLLPNRVPGGSWLSAYLQGNTKTPISAATYQTDIKNYYRNITFIKSLPDATRYSLRNSVVPVPPVKWRLGYDLLGVGLLIIEQLANLVAALGGLLMVVRRDAPVIVRQIGLLALVITLLLTLIRFSGTLATAYGQERAQLQGLVFLAVSLCWTGHVLAGSQKKRQARVLTLATLCLAVLLVNTSYLAGAALGGGTSANLANSGSAYEYFVASTPELASAEWLGKAAEPGQLVYADEYAQLPLAATTGIQNGLILDVTPATIDSQAWIYASRTNVIDGRAFALYNDHLATYYFPFGFLNDNFDLVYTNGSSEVFHR